MTDRPVRLLAAVAAGLVVLGSSAARAQEAAGRSGEILELHALHREAVSTDARAREFELLQAQVDLRLQNIAADWRPSLNTLVSAQYQSAVPTSPIVGPNGRPAFAAPKDTYDASLRVDQRLYDPTIQSREALTRAEVAESQARLRVALFGLRAQVNEAFFTAALYEQEMRALEATIAELEGRLKETTASVAAGAALPSDGAMIEATILQHRQQLAALRANRRAALDRLASLSHRPIGSAATLAIPDLTAAVRTAQESLATSRARPEFEQFARAADKTMKQQDLTAADERPRVSAYGRVGYGQPGLNFINEGFDSYALGGVQLQW
jgi:outer membrane protein TolC